ncbi:MAG TPA: ACT domain-containing protein, partial [Acidimicrobiales bacterium]|nr:ACT domain-containing protein [Acidimicrobiales bacterium]
IEAGPASDVVRPFLEIAEILGRFVAALSGGLPGELTVEYQGGLADEDVSLLTLGALKGLFSGGTEEPVSYVNAPRLAEERGLVVSETHTATSPDRVSVIRVRSAEHSVSGALVAGSARIVEVDDHDVEVPPADVMVVVRNDDRPGMIGVVGTVLGNAGVSIANMAVGQTKGGGTALMVLATDQLVPESVLSSLRAADGILEVSQATTA